MPHAPVWIEAALNGPWTQRRQPLMPITVKAIVEDALACAAEGAAIIHVHAYDRDTGLQDDNWETYARIIENIRVKADVIVYPTIPFMGHDPKQQIAPEKRFESVEELAKRGLLEWAVIDPGSVNLSHCDDRASGKTGFVYLNPEDHIQHGLELAAAYDFHPSYALYEPGFARLGAALAVEVENLPPPIYRAMFSDDFAFGLPFQPWAIAAYDQVRHTYAPADPWMIAGLAIDIRAQIPTAIARGMHVRAGLEDAPWGSTALNRDWIAAIAQGVLDAGAEPASTATIRRDLAQRKMHVNNSRPTV